MALSAMKAHAAKSALTAIVVVSAALGLTACSGLFPAPTPTPTPIEPTGDGTLVIGDLAPLTGSLAPTSLAQMAGVELAARELNDDGGFNGTPLQVFHRNAGEGDPAITSASVQALLAKGADVIIVPAVPSVASQVMQEVAGKNVAVLAIASAENAPAGASTDPVVPDATFAARLGSADPALIDPAVAVYSYGVESYDLTIATALAAYVTADDGGSSLILGLQRVTAPSGIGCTSYGMCVDILHSQPAINYIGLAGQINYDPTTGVVYFGELTTTAPTESSTPSATP